MNLSNILDADVKSQPAVGCRWHARNNNHAVWYTD